MLPSMALSASASVYGHAVNRFLPPIIAFAVTLDHFLTIFLLQHKQTIQLRAGKMMQTQ